MIFEFQSPSNILSVNSLFCLSLLKLTPVTCQGKEPWLSWDVRVGLIYSSLITSPSSIHLPPTKKYFSPPYYALSSRHCPGCWGTRANKTQSSHPHQLLIHGSSRHGSRGAGGRFWGAPMRLSLGKRASGNASWRRWPSWDLRGEEKLTNWRGEEGKLLQRVGTARSEGIGTWQIWESGCQVYAQRPFMGKVRRLTFYMSVPHNYYLLKARDCIFKIIIMNT